MSNLLAKGVSIEANETPPGSSSVFSVEIKIAGDSTVLQSFEPAQVKLIRIKSLLHSIQLTLSDDNHQSYYDTYEEQKRHLPSKVSLTDSLKC